MKWLIVALKLLLIALLLAGCGLFQKRPKVTVPGCAYSVGVPAECEAGASYPVEFPDRVEYHCVKHVFDKKAHTITVSEQILTYRCAHIHIGDEKQ